MKFMGMALAVGIVLGPLGMMGIGYALVGILLAVALAAMSGSVAAAIGVVPGRRLPPVKRWH